MWKVIVLVASTATLALVGVLTARTANMGNPPDVFVTVFLFAVLGFLLAFLAIRNVNRL